MSVQRVLTDEERTRRTLGWVFVVGGLAGLGVLGAVIRQLGSIDLTLGLLLGLPSALLALGLWLAVIRNRVLEVDPEARSYVVIEKGRRGQPRPLDDLGPLVVTLRSRTVRSKNSTRTILEYPVHPEGQPKLDFHVEKSASRARSRMEALARAWNLPCRSYGGDLRRPDELDKPLHERLRLDHAARQVRPLKAEWGLALQPLAQGHAIVSTHRSWAPLGQAALMLLPALVVVGAIFRTGLLATVSSPDAGIEDRVFLGLLGVVLLALLVVLAKGARDTFLPGQVRVGPEGVSYRGKRMRFSEIEEVIGGYGVELVGDRRSLRIPPFFCPAEATPVLVHELRRLIVEVAPMGES